MKSLISIALAISCFVLSPPRINRAGLFVTEDRPCTDGSFTVVDANAPARLSIMAAQCNGPKWNATLVLTNTGDKVITGYDISNVETYERKKNVESSQGQSGFKLEPTQSMEIPSKGGFRDGLSYGKRTGSIRQNIFRLTRLEFADGTIWRSKPTS